MAHPLVVHFKKDPFDVYVGRISPWGNPFSHSQKATKAYWQAFSREDAVYKHKNWLMKHRGLLLRVRLELKGKYLGCWCAPQLCHAEFLAEVANDDAWDFLDAADEVEIEIWKNNNWGMPTRQAGFNLNP